MASPEKVVVTEKNPKPGYASLGLLLVLPQTLG
jgi:hypothetical protein